MGILRVTLGSIAVLTLMGCSTMRVRTDYSERASFRHLQTYAWIERQPDNAAKEAVNSPLLGEYIQLAVDAELARRGFRKLESGRPDFLIAYRVITREKIGASGTSPYGDYVMLAAYGYGHYGRRSYGHRFRHHGHYGGGFGYGSRRYGYYGGHRSRLYFGFGHHRGYYGHGYGNYGYGSYLDDYLEGTLVLDIIDPVANEIIWRGWASDALGSDPDPGRVRMYVKKAVQEILAEFPPTA